METYITSLLGTKSLCVYRWDFLMQMFASPNIVTKAQGIVPFPLKKGNITLSRSVKETYEVIEDAISEALMSDHSVAIKYFVRRIWEVLSIRLIQLARLISS